MMSAAGGPARSEAMATLHVVLHELKTDERLADWLQNAESEVDKLSPMQRANVREIRRAVGRAQGIPAQLVARASEAQMRSEHAWRTMRADNNWADFEPHLQAVVDLKREEAAALGASLGLDPYDALLDEFEPGLRSAEIDAVFSDLRAFLPGFIDRVIEKQSRDKWVTPEGPFALPAQEELGKRLMEAVGFFMDAGRLDVSHHPFCGGNARDVRITTRYDTNDFTTALLGVLHETGHAKYEQGLPAEWLEQPVGHARGMSIHEGQSLLQEMQVSRSRAFLEFAAPLMAEAFPLSSGASPAAYEVGNLYGLYTRVTRSKIRVDADEVTYPCHILLRYGLEKALIDGSLQVCDLPEAWDAGMQDLLGISTGMDFRDGCMQDVHWPAGAFGYFPTYTLGAMTAAQLFAAANRAVPNLAGMIARGEFEPLNDFLRANIWQHGSLYETPELMRRATGAELSADPLKAHLASRYLEE